MKNQKKPRCHNCKYSGTQFKIDKLTHLHCEHPDLDVRASVHPQDSAWATLRVFNDNCKDHEFKTKTLHLNLKKKWFDMILSGEKKEEYREIKISMVSLLFNWRNEPNWSRQDFVREFEYHGNEIGMLKHSKEFDTITFSNGYAKDRPQFEIEFKGIEIREGNTEWGALYEKDYFVLKLGNIIK